MKDQKERCHDDKTHYTGFGTNRSAGQPSRAVKRGIQQLAGRNEATIGHAEHKSLRVIPRGMKPYGEPDRTCTAQRKAEKETDRRRGKSAKPGFTGVTQMPGAKKQRQQ